MADTSKSTFENINELIRALVWPTTIFLAFLSYKSEFNQIIKLIPRKLESSSKISLGSLSFEIEQTAKSSGNVELGEIIKDLSEDEIRKLLTLGSGGHMVMMRTSLHPSQYSTTTASYTTPADLSVLQSLDEHGLLKSNEPFKDFIKFVKRLNPILNTRYRMKNGNSTSDKRSQDAVQYTEFTIPFSNLSARDSKRLDGFTVELSESGKRAFEIIVHVTAEQINRAE